VDLHGFDGEGFDHDVWLGLEIGCFGCGREPEEENGRESNAHCAASKDEGCYPHFRLNASEA
jgi:hypothetical protein